MSKAVIFVPGIMGSELRLKDKLVWPGPASSLIFEYKMMAELQKPKLEVGKIIRKFSFTSQYESLIEDLNECGFKEEDKTLFLLAYDWRRSIEEASSLLAETIAKIHVSSRGETKIILIGHSMGGLVCRCFLESGSYNRSPGFESVTNLITLATPHRGVAISLTASQGLEKRLFLSAAQVQALVNNKTFPSLYQMLPRQGEPFVWDSAPQAAFSLVDIFDKRVIRDLSLTEENVAAALEFHSKLNLEKRPPNVRYFFFCGSSQSTLTRINLRKANPIQIDCITSDCGGDGTVPMWSGFVSSIQGEFVGGEHGSIYKNTTLRRTLGVLLGKPTLLAGYTEKLQIFVGAKVVEPNKMLSLTIELKATCDRIVGILRLEKIESDELGDIKSSTSVGADKQIILNGARFTQFVFAVISPSVIGQYRYTFIVEDMGQTASDDFFVQQC